MRSRSLCRNRTSNFRTRTSWTSGTTRSNRSTRGRATAASTRAHGADPEPLPARGAGNAVVVRVLPDPARDDAVAVDPNVQLVHARVCADLALRGIPERDPAVQRHPGAFVP